MDDHEPPAREDARIKYTGETTESINKKYTPIRLLTWIVAILFVVFGVIWLGYALGLLAVLFPGGPGIFEGWIWGIAGLVGIGLVAYLIYMARTD